ncbi:flagellar hook-length control protein FliK [Metabacillus iocasae]|uniref:Flagellar hook-length control protein FliK n=1 Tax=Priestia iocasae TaxID=2291674 RepID=A0ABS2QTN8_9BACI|nr:flagellar hook-length control protein FliK [Metabacillus iocasae]
MNVSILPTNQRIQETSDTSKSGESNTSFGDLFQLLSSLNKTDMEMLNVFNPKQKHPEVNELIELIENHLNFNSNLSIEETSFLTEASAEFNLIEFEENERELLQALEVMEMIITTIPLLEKNIQPVNDQITKLQSLVQGLHANRVVLSSELSKSDISSLLEAAKNILTIFQKEVASKEGQKEMMNVPLLFGDKKQVEPSLGNPLFTRSEIPKGQQVALHLHSFSNRQEIEAPSFVNGEMAKTQQLVLHLNQTSNETELDSAQLMKQMQRLLSKASFIQNDQQSRLLIKLFPEHLGSLQIELIKQGNQFTARMVASTAQAKELLDGQIQALKQAFVNQQIQIDKIDIQQQPHLFERAMINDGKGQRENEKQPSHQQEPEEAEVKEEAEFKDALADVLINYNI